MQKVGICLFCCNGGCGVLDTSWAATKVIGGKDFIELQSSAGLGGRALGSL